MKRTILIFERADGKCPFQDWLLNLNDVKARAIIRARLERIALGNLGDCKSIGGGISELRISYGPGYRVYIGFDGQRYVVLLCGGDKGSQKRDITKARVLWEEYKKCQ